MLNLSSHPLSTALLWLLEWTDPGVMTTWSRRARWTGYCGRSCPPWTTTPPTAAETWGPGKLLIVRIPIWWHISGNVSWLGTRQVGHGRFANYDKKLRCVSSECTFVTYDLFSSLTSGEPASRLFTTKCSLSPIYWRLPCCEFILVPAETSSNRRVVDQLRFLGT